MIRRWIRVLCGLHNHRWSDFCEPFTETFTRVQRTQEEFSGQFDNYGDPIYIEVNIKPYTETWVETFQQRVCYGCGLVDKVKLRVRNED